MTDSFVAEARGLDLREAQEPAILREIANAMDRYAVLVFRGQQLSQAEQLAFARQMGPPDTKLNAIMKFIQNRMDSPEISDISNVDESGEVADKNHRQAMMNIGNRIWHTDSSFMETPWRYSMLYAVTAVSWGGQTQWADLRAAYDALDDRMRELIDDLVAEHYALQSRMILGYTDSSEAELKLFPPVRWPLVRTHAGSGRKLLFVSSSIREIIGMSLPAGRELAAELLEHATQREFVHSHQWAPGDFVMWDNRSVLHRGRRFDETERREMRRVATVDDVPALPIDEDSRTKIFGQPAI
ncbi:TauD/TfdA dioxygenase family protein [Mycolicibacterium hodleri]|uniref:TauD/TfdA dioxygenase family protein n=1 Tax=Mycolicibacterium hodleri TaxID=49897 RepID=UPI001F38A403|nr:TauD/TfdA family dioxygenase [Mycolicibacterium hodleri]